MSLTPKQAYDAAKLIYPLMTHIEKSSCDSFVICSNPGTNPKYQEKVDWGKTDKYPLPEPKWRDVVPADLTFPWPEVRVKKHNPDANTWSHTVYLCSIGYGAQGEMFFGGTDGNTYVAAQIREKA